MVLERGPSAKSFRSCSFFYRSILVPFCSEQKNGLPVPFCSWRSQLKNSCIPLVLFLIKNVCIPPSVHSNEQLHPRQVLQKRSFYFRDDGIILDRSVHSRERTIVPPGTRPALHRRSALIGSRQQLTTEYCNCSLLLGLGFST